jgi:multidrug efflux system outer membrane protein
MTIRRLHAVRRLRALPAALALTLLASALLPAEEAKGLPAAPPTVGQLTLAEALALADALNDTTQVARARLDQALAVRRQALSLLLPNISADGGLMKYTVAVTPFGPNRKLIGDQDNLAVNLNLTLFNASSVDALKAQNAVVSAQRLDSGELRRGLAYQVTAGFLLTIAAEHQVEAAVRARDVAKETVDQTKARQKVGVATANDVTRSELTLATNELSLTQDRQAVVAARFSLGDLVGREVKEALIEPEPALVPSRDLPEMEKLGLEGRPDLASSVLRIRGTELLADATRMNILPNLGVRGTWELNSQQPAVAYPNSPEWQVALVASWTLYDGGNREATVDLYEGQRREASANLNQARRDLHRDVATALAALQTAEISFSQSTVARNVARINEDETLARFKQGLATALDAADANAQTFQAESDLVGRQLDLASSRFTLRQLIGRWPLTDAMPTAAPVATAPAAPAATAPTVPGR